MSNTINPHHEQDFNIGLTIANVPEILLQWTERSAKARDEIGTASRAVYGGGEREVLDIYLPTGAQASSGKVIVFWHGGFFRRVNSCDNTFVVPALLEHGFIVVMGEYGLAPTYTVPQILSRTRAAHDWIYRNIGQFGGDPHRVFGIGHSVGALILADVMATDWPRRREGMPPSLLAGGLAISGIFDMQPIRHTSLNEDLRMNGPAAEAASPMRKKNRSGARLTCVVGDEETAGFKRQSLLMASSGSVRNNWRGPYSEIPGANHLTILDQLANPISALWHGPLRMLGSH